MLFTKDFETNQEHVEPANADLTLIRQYAQREVKAEEVWCGALKACNTAVDRSGERFTKAYLQRFRDTIPGKALLEGHDYGRRPLGRIYKADVIPEDGNHYLKAFYYVKADSPIVAEIELGIAKDCSIGFNASRRVCDLCGKEWRGHSAKSGDFCEHWPLDHYDEGVCTLAYCDTAVEKAEAMEISLVWAGCQYGAQAVEKGLAPGLFDYEPILRMIAAGFLPAQGGTTMPTVEELQAQLTETKAAHQTRESEWTREQAELKARAGEGDKFRAHLKAEITRFAGMLGDQKTYATILDHLQDASAEKLIPVWEELGEKVDARFSHGQGHTGGTADENHDKPRRRSPFVRGGGL